VEAIEMSEELPLLPEDISWEEAQAKLEALDLGDGLPLVPPTMSRYEAMLSNRGSPEESFGFLMPLMGNLTLGTAAYNCVLAGCRPEDLSVVLTAAEACTAEEFNLLGLLSTTGTPTVAVCVQGPIVDELGINAGGNVLGPGKRANACIGRAVSLIMRNVAGARPGVADMATMGQPGKYTFCFGERAHSGFPSLPERKGFDATDNCVTVLGVSGTAEVLPTGASDTPERVLEPIAVAMNSNIDITSLSRKPERNEQVFLIPPEIADILTNHGWDLVRVQAYLQGSRCAYVYADNDETDDRPLAPTPEDIHPIITGGVGIKMTHVPLWAGGSRMVTRKLREF
jgi:hypothetical protein